jgi:IS30 family transposase
MGKCYSQLSGDERNELQRGLNEGMSLRALARSMGRNPSTLSREYRRGSLQSSYDAVQGGGWARSHRRRGPCKLLPGNRLTEQVHTLILERTWPPEQIHMKPGRCFVATEPLMVSSMSRRASMANPAALISNR